MPAPEQPIGPPLPHWAPATRPAAVRLTGRHCRLEPLTGEHAPALFAAYGQDRSGRLWTYLPYGPFASAADYADWIASMAADPGVHLLAILDATTGAPTGVGGYLRMKPAGGSIEVGHLAFSPALQRTTAATEAMYLMAGHAFDELGYRRYEWKCDALNAASFAAARRLGFTPEGIWRQATIYKGRSRDTAWLAMTDGDWSRLRPAYEAWLDPANFAPDGSQRSALRTLTAAALITPAPREDLLGETAPAPAAPTGWPEP